MLLIPTFRATCSRNSFNIAYRSPLARAISQGSVPCFRRMMPANGPINRRPSLPAQHSSTSLRSPSPSVYVVFPIHSVQHPKADPCRPGRFHTTALAVSAAHRISSPPNTSDLESNISPQSSSANSGVRLRRGKKSLTDFHWLSPPPGPQGGGTGDEPGVDVRSRRDEEAYNHLKGSANITVRHIQQAQAIAGSTEWVWV